MSIMNVVKKAARTFARHKTKTTPHRAAARPVHRKTSPEAQVAKKAVSYAKKKF